MEKSIETPFSRVEKNLLHFFICVRLFDLQWIGMKFRAEEACMSRFFARFRITWVEMENINIKSQEIADEVSSKDDTSC